MSTIQPNLQTRINDPYQQRLFDFGTSDSRLYLARVSNQLLRTFGDDLVLKGFDIQSITASGSIATVTISGGLAILDHTLIQIDDPILSIDFDVASYDETGKLVLHLNYEFLQTVEDNPVRLKLSYVDSTGSSISPDGWNWNKDRLVLAVIEFTKNPSNNITNIQEIQDVIKSVTIQSHTFYKQGYDPTEPQNLNNYFNNSSIINTKITISNNDHDKKPLINKITTENSSITKNILTPQPDSETLNLTLENDNSNPGNDMFYATDPTGAKGWLPSPFSENFSLLSKQFIDEALIVFSPLGVISYDARGNISTIESTLRNGEILTLSHSYNTRDDLTTVSASVNSTAIWTKTYNYNIKGDVSGWSVTIF